MIKNILSFILLFLAVLIFATWQYRLECILLFVGLNRRWIESFSLTKRFRWSYPILVGILAVCIFIAIPNYFQRGRIQLVYLNKDGKETRVSLPVYLANALLPEEEACNLSIKALALSQVKSSLNVAGHHVGGMLLKDFHSDIMNGRILHFYSPYNNLTWKLSNPGSIAYGQLWNEMTGQSNDAIYIKNRLTMTRRKNIP